MLKLKPQFVSKNFPLSPRIKSETQKFLRLIKKSRSFLISSTLTSDGDSIGAQLALAALIRAVKKGSRYSIRIVNQSEVPERYQFLHGHEEIYSWAQWTQKAEKITFDLGIVCDGGIERTGAVAGLFETIDHKVLVDHHALGSELKYSSRILDLTSSSSCELVYHIFDLARIKISRAVAEALYIGMVFDTGFFKHSLTTSRTHLVAAKLIETGIDFSKISDRAILDRTWKAQLLLKALMAHMEARNNAKLISSYWTLADFESIQSRDGDQEGMINQLYFTDSAEVVVLFVERENDVKVSFRSKGKINVAEFARHLNPQGGGHVRAAGCTLPGLLTDVMSRVLDELSALIQ